MIVKRMSLAILCLGLGLSLTARADEGKSKQHRKSLHDEFTGQQYGPAGCGLGSIAFADKPGMIQVIASTLNGTMGNQTFGISSGTSNCEESAQKQGKVALFIEVNKHALARDVSRGQGEALQSLAKIVGCPSENLAPALKNNYEEIFSDENDNAETTGAIFGVIRSSSQLQQCSALG